MLNKFTKDFKLHKELRRFFVVGFSAVGTDFIVYYILINFFSHAPSKGLSFLAGTILAYFLNKYWTFEKKEKNNLEMTSFLILYLGTLIVNVAVNQTSLFFFKEYVFLAFLFATGTSTILNFVGQKWWVFK